MTIENETIAQNAAAASARISEIRELFGAIRQTLMGQLQDMPEVQPTTPKHLIAKINELQATLVLLLKAEEAYYEKYGHDELQISVDHDAIRDQIGGHLDRIRKSRHPESLSEGVRTAPD